MKSILTIAASVLVFGSSQLMACPLMDGKQKVTELNQLDQTEHLIESDVEIIDPVLLARLLLEQQEKEQEEIN